MADSSIVASIPLVLLHGLNRNGRAMSSLQRAFESDGRQVININYPSGRYCIADLTHWVHNVLHTRCGSSVDSGIDFATHSLGGSVVRMLRREYRELAIRRVAMLSPPNQGSEVVDVLGRLALFKWIAGPAGGELGTAATSVPNSLGPVDFEVGVVAGNFSLNPLYSSFITGPNDGTVAVERMRVEGMTDFVIVRASHTFIMHNAIAIEQARHFIAHGRFDRHIDSDASR